MPCDNFNDEYKTLELNFSQLMQCSLRRNLVSLCDEQLKPLLLLMQKKESTENIYISNRYAIEYHALFTLILAIREIVMNAHHEQSFIARHVHVE